QPDTGKNHQPVAGNPRLTGPGLPGRQHEPGDDGHGKAEEHLVTVPGQPATGGLKTGPETGPGCDPEGNGEHGKDAAGEKERAKRKPPHGRNTSGSSPTETS